MIKNTFLYLIFCVGLIFPQDSLTSSINYNKLAENVLILKSGEVYPDKVVAVKTAKGIILFDTGISPTLAEEYRKIIIWEFGIDKFLYVVNTHHHFDHTNGNQVFDDAVIIAHENCSAKMMESAGNFEEFIQYRKERYLRRNELAKTLNPNSDLCKRLNDLVFMSKHMCADFESKFILTLPNLTFTGELSINLGDITLKLFHFPPGFHTDNDIIAIIPELKLIFTGDLLTDDESLASVTSDNNLEQAVKVLDKVLSETQNGANIITVHSGILSVEYLQNFRKRLKEMLEIKQNKKSLVDVIEKDFDDFGIKDVLNSFEKLKNNPAFYLWEGDLIEMANRYFLSEKKEIGIALFELCIKLFPTSVNAFEWLGDAYYQIGEYNKAESSFNAALELNPVNSFAADMVYQIKNKLESVK